MDFEDHPKVVTLREQCRDDERPVRLRVREQSRFLKHRDGQWEENALKKFNGRPRYQFDYTSRVVNDICSEIEQNEFGGRVVPKGPDSNDDVAEILDGMLRSIQNMSGADNIYKKVGRHLVECGFDAFLVCTDWADVDAFEQDIMFKPIPDAVNRVWVDTDWAEEDRSDSRYGFMDSSLSPAEYKKQFPGRTPSSLDRPEDLQNRNESEKQADKIRICDFYYLVFETKTIHLLSDGRVLSDEKLQPVLADLAVRGVVIEKTRERLIPCCYMRKFDNGGWLNDEKETAFAYIPLITAYANSDFIDGEFIYFGETEKLMDPQRVFNYARSRDIEETAFAPRRKIFMTPAQTKGHEEQLRTLNINSDPVQIYNPDATPGAVQPYESNGPQINPALANISQASAQDIQNISGNFAPSQGKPVSGHSGVAYELLQNKSDSGNNHYLEALKVVIAYANKIVLDAVPRVYDTRGRQARLMGEDGTVKFETVNDEKNGEVINDLSNGRYRFEVVCGPSFRNRKAEGLSAMMGLMSINPSILQDGGDLLVKSMEAPYVNQLAERIRYQMIKEGRIPIGQLTDEEKEKIQQEMQQQNQPNPLDELTQQALAAQIQKLMSDMQVQQQKAADDHAKAISDMAAQAAKTENVMADTLKLISEALGAQAIVSPAAINAFNNTAQDLSAMTN